MGDLPTGMLPTCSTAKCPTRAAQGTLEQLHKLRCQTPRRIPFSLLHPKDRLPLGMSSSSCSSSRMPMASCSRKLDTSSTYSRMLLPATAQSSGVLYTEAVEQTSSLVFTL